MAERETINFFGQTNFRNQKVKFGIKTDDRRRHMYVIGKTGMGKTTMLENMVYSDVMNGHGVCYLDPHGDTAEKILSFIPSHRVNDVIYFDPGDRDFPIAFNVLESRDEALNSLVASGLLGVFKKIWADSWGPRLEYILRNTLLALIDFPESTLLGVPRMLADKNYRKKVVSGVKDPVVRAFWENEFSKWNDRQLTEAIAPIQNKVGQFLSMSLIRNIVGQVKSTINIREIMDQRKILILNLSKGRIGEDASSLLGAMMITQIYLAAMSRVDVKNEADRPDFYLYVDEFQNFATDSFANILSEARKYHLNLIIAHQYINQLDEKVSNAVFGNVGTLATFRVGAADAEELVKEFTPHFTPEDIVNLPKFNIYLKLMIDGVASNPFSAATLPPLFSKEGHEEKIVRISRERYAKPRQVVEEKILKWSAPPEKDQNKNDDKGGRSNNRDNKSRDNRSKNNSSRSDRSSNSDDKKSRSKSRSRNSSHSNSSESHSQNEEKKPLNTDAKKKLLDLKSKLASKLKEKTLEIKDSQNVEKNSDKKKSNSSSKKDIQKNDEKESSKKSKNTQEKKAQSENDSQKNTKNKEKSQKDTQQPKNEKVVKPGEKVDLEA